MQYQAKETSQNSSIQSPGLQRFLDGIPGFLVWVVFVFCLIFAIFYPQTMLTIVAIVAIYTAIRFIMAAGANLIGLRRIRQWEATDWYAKYQADADENALPWDAIQHVVIIPNYNEPEHVLRKTLDHLSQQFEAKKRLTVVMAMEAGETGSADKAEALQAHYSDLFANFLYSVHPRGLPGELPGKSSNLGWAGRWVKEELIDKRGYNPDHIVVTSTDADIVWHPKHFIALTYAFAINPARYQRIYQGIIRYHGNIWGIHPFLRVVNAYSTAFEQAYLAADWWTRLPISSYSISMRLLMEIDFWDVDSMADDWHTYVKSYFGTKGKLKVEALYLPFMADAATGETFWEAMKARYDQTLRHAWGSREVTEFAMRMFIYKDMPYPRTLRVLTRIAHDILLAGAGWVLITVGSQLPILLHQEYFPYPLQKLLDNPVLLIVSGCGLLIVGLGIIFWYQDVRVRPPRTHKMTFSEWFLTLISFPLLPVLSLFFLSLPVIQAQTKLMLGSQLEYRVTKKF